MHEKEENIKTLYSNIKIKGSRLVRVTMPSLWKKKEIKLFVEGINIVMNDITNFNELKRND